MVARRAYRVFGLTEADRTCWPEINRPLAGEAVEIRQIAGEGTALLSLTNSATRGVLVKRSAASTKHRITVSAILTCRG